MLAWLGNLKIAAKVTIAPALAIVGLIGLAGAAHYVFDGLASNFHYLNDTAFARFSEGEKLQNAVSRMHAQLYSVISLAANANDAKSVAARADAAAKELPGIVRRGEALRAMVDNPDDVKALATALADYTKDAQGALDMAQIDAAMSLLLMGTVQDEFDKLNQRLDAFTAASDRGRTQTFETAIRSIDGARVAFLLGALCAVGLAVAASFIAARAIGRPVGALTGIMGTLASGTTDVAIPHAERRDEVGAMARAVAIFRENAVERAGLAAAHEREQEAGLEHARRLEAQVREFDAKVSGILAGFASAARDMTAAAVGMTATAEQTSRQAATVATAAEQASANVQTVAAAAEELTASVGEIGRQVSQSTRIAGQAVAEANRTDATVLGLSAAAHKIGDVVKLISDIASQTNLLALNATIEAARAGEAGKGFAVVASEVKSLANQTAKATEEISAQVAAMRGATSEVVEAIHSIGGTIGSINEIATTIASAVEEQGAATREIARNVQEAAQGTGQVTSNIVGVNQAATETGGAAGRVLAAAGALGSQAETLRTHVDKFLADIRAA